MHSLFSTASGMTHDVIGAAIEVHKDKGPGLLESIYEWCLTKELELRDHSIENQQHVTVRYKQFQREYPLRFDLLIDGCLFVEVKATDAVHPIHKALAAQLHEAAGHPIGADYQLQRSEIDRRSFTVDSAGGEQVVTA